MNNNEFLNELLNLEKLQVMQAEFAGTEQITLFVESTLAAAICPDCDQVSTRIHDLGAVQMIRDLSIGERRCYLSYQARRFDCEHCDKTFVERVDWKRPGVSYTLRIGRERIRTAIHFNRLRALPFRSGFIKNGSPVINGKS